ncbi:cation diffusion facilitator family transporter [Algoriphagus sp. CAU 1675]|uniref:cation diffusion facilitator family transporter n=1 Tax=Algoriphagus sp. CAU 1675 TaxID=3032597 RepID=UPI0023DAB5D1|nr:cation diffusion facilitator family transporter [Algoriphagus sp. CAU 1675]MDF2158119.1 cation diffusion facilitator family transporter [Algoriphagus sp. CAU 1675]
MAHHHNHHHHSSEKGLKTAFFLNLAFTILEIFGGIWVNSIAILSDAIHDLGDSISLGLAWFLDRKSKQEANASFSFGYGRFSLLGALINSLLLIGGSIFIISEAIQRFANPEPSNAPGMIGFAILGITINAYAAWKVSRGNSQNEKVISWHLIEDVLGWAAVFIAGIVMYFYEVPWLDPALSLAISIFILWNVFKNLRETTYIFLQAVPENISLEELKAKICALPHVESMHHTHLWSLEGSNHVFTAHIRMQNIHTLEELRNAKEEVKSILKTYPFSHYTVEWELENEPCSMMEESHHHHQDK